MAPNAVTLPDGNHAPAQVVPVGLNEAGKGSRLVFVLPKLKAGESVTATPKTLNYFVAPPHFEFVEKPGEPTELMFTSTNVKRPVLAYFNPPHDPKDHYYTFKPFHHVFDPAKGKMLLTNASAKTAKDGPCSRTTAGCSSGGTGSATAKQDRRHLARHEQRLRASTTRRSARRPATCSDGSVSAISWHGKDGKTFATEQRELTAYAVPGGTLIDCASELTTELAQGEARRRPAARRVPLPGQHGGVEERQEEHVLPASGREGEARRDAELGPRRGADPRTINLPWNAMSFVVGGKRYTVLRINHPDNPKEARGSERDYGRFGDYFEYDRDAREAAPGEVPRLGSGRRDDGGAAAMAAAFAPRRRRSDPPPRTHAPGGRITPPGRSEERLCRRSSSTPRRMPNENCYPSRVKIASSQLVAITKDRPVSENPHARIPQAPLSPMQTDSLEPGADR